ncbi:MAG: hypothetical protein KatS3mg057_1754 [Herpetosiphonaceae bacterium]|nr:MAG: hypothetical protein KatS3mg057_1754 [Herpetosiphonaceae bacterium]
MLKQGIRREDRWRYWVAAILLLIMGALGLYSTVAGIESLHLFNEIRLRVAGETTEALVLNIERVRVARSSEPRVSYQFSVDGRTITEENRGVRYSTYQQARETRRISVIYLPDDPAINRPANSTEPVFLLIGCILGLAFLCYGGHIAYRLIKTRSDSHLQSTLGTQQK